MPHEIGCGAVRLLPFNGRVAIASRIRRRPAADPRPGLRLGRAQPLPLVRTAFVLLYARSRARSGAVFTVTDKGGTSMAKAVAGKLFDKLVFRPLIGWVKSLELRFVNIGAFS